MTYEWTAVAGVLYMEMILIALMLIPFISPLLWQKFFKSIIITIWTDNKYLQLAYMGTIIGLLLATIDDISRYSQEYQEWVSDGNYTPTEQQLAENNMLLLEAQRNICVTSGVLFCFLILKALTWKLELEARLMIADPEESKAEFEKIRQLFIQDALSGSVISTVFSSIPEIFVTISRAIASISLSGSRVIMEISRLIRLIIDAIILMISGLVGLTVSSPSFTEAGSEQPYTEKQSKPDTNSALPRVLAPQQQPPVRPPPEVAKSK